MEDWARVWRLKRWRVMVLSHHRRFHILDGWPYRVNGTSWRGRVYDGRSQVASRKWQLMAENHIVIPWTSWCFWSVMLSDDCRLQLWEREAKSKSSRYFNGTVTHLMIKIASMSNRHNQLRWEITDTVRVGWERESRINVRLRHTMVPWELDGLHYATTSQTTKTLTW